MYWSFHNSVNDLINMDNSLKHTLDTFKAFVDVIIPRTVRLAEEFGRIQYYGALDLYTNEYLVMSLNNYYIPLAEPAAAMLDAAANELLSFEGNNNMIKYPGFPGWATFNTLSPNARFRALSLLDQQNINPDYQPASLQSIPGVRFSITSDLNRLTMMGYYSEWSGYGTTRLEEPNQRRLEFYPLSWKQVGYPGPSLGYPALRE